MEVIS